MEGCEKILMLSVCFIDNILQDAVQFVVLDFVKKVTGSQLMIS